MLFDSDLASDIHWYVMVAKNRAGSKPDQTLYRIFRRAGSDTNAWRPTAFVGVRVRIPTSTASNLNVPQGRACMNQSVPFPQSQ